MGCLEKIQLNQVLIQKFMKSFLSASNAYDMYHVGVWFRTLSYHSAQIFPTSEGIPKQARTKLTKKFIRQFFKKTIRYKTAARRKDGEDYILWKLLLPAWKSSFHHKFDLLFGKWFYENFRQRIISSLISLFPLIFDRMCRLHRLRIVDEMCTVKDWNSRFNSGKLLDKLHELLDFSDENPDRLNKQDHDFLIKKQLINKNIVRGYTCRVDSVVFNFTTNRLLGTQLIENFYS